MKKLIFIGILLTALIGVIFYLLHAGEIITSSSMSDSRISYGYEIGRRSYLNGSWIKIWNSRGLNFSYYDSNLAITKIVEERWVGENRAVYLKLDIAVRHDSYSKQSDAQILYDFRRGELYVTSIDPLWRTGEVAEHNVGNKLWMNKEEFQNVLIELEK